MWVRTRLEAEVVLGLLERAANELGQAPAGSVRRGDASRRFHLHVSAPLRGISTVSYLRAGRGDGQDPLWVAEARAQPDPAAAPGDDDPPTLGTLALRQYATTGAGGEVVHGHAFARLRECFVDALRALDPALTVGEGEAPPVELA